MRQFKLSRLRSMVRPYTMYVPFLSFRIPILTCIQCVDIEFAEPEDVAEVTRDNCFNSSNLQFEFIFTTSSLQVSDAIRLALSQRVLSVLPLFLAGLFGYLMM